jgi:hypothetical protein
MTKNQWWTNIYRRIDAEGEYYFIDGPWRSKEKALEYIDKEQEYINTIRIEQEEEL